MPQRILKMFSQRNLLRNQLSLNPTMLPYQQLPLWSLLNYRLPTMSASCLMSCRSLLPQVLRSEYLP